MKRPLLTPIAALIVALATLALMATPASAATVEGATASAFGVRAHVALLGHDLAKIGPTPYAAVPNIGGDDVNASSRTIIGPVRIPADGSLISDLRVLSVEATRGQKTLPSARASSQVAHVALFEQSGTPAIDADAIHAVSSSVCTASGKANVSADGSHFVALTINGQTIDATPPPNTVIPLTDDGGTPADPTDDRGIKVILNEQTGANHGTGLIVTMLHVIVYDAIQSNLVFADVKIAEARSSVFCSETTPPTDNNGDDRGVGSDKTVTTTSSDLNGATDGTEATAHRGDNVTWKVTITNTGTNGCGLQVVTDTLPAYFAFVSSKGDLTTGSAPTVDGQSVTWNNPTRYTLKPGDKLTETIVAKVANNAPFGTYTNLLDVEESTCSSFTQGLRGPVTVEPVSATQVKGVKTVAPAPTLTATGSSGKLPLAAIAAGLLLLLAGAGAIRTFD